MIPIRYILLKKYCIKQLLKYWCCFADYKVLSTLMNFADAAMPLHMAPSTFGETQKSPQIANRLFPNHKHFSSPATLAAGNALPLRKRKKKKTFTLEKYYFYY